MMNFHIDVSLQEGKELNLVFWVERGSRYVHNEPYQNLRLAETHLFQNCPSKPDGDPKREHRRWGIAPQKDTHWV